MAIRVRFGNEDPEVYRAGCGHIFVPWLPAIFRCYLKKYPMAMFDLDYDPIEVMSKEGKFPEPDGPNVGAVNLKVNSMAYLNYPREREGLEDVATDDLVCFMKDLSPVQRAELISSGQTTYNVTPARNVVVALEKTHPLIKILRAGVPTTKAELEDWTEESMTSSVRSAASQITWKQANQDPAAFKDQVERSYLNVDGILIQAGFRPSGIKLAIKLVDPPQSLKEALAGVEAAPHVAKRESVEVGDALLQMVEKRIQSEGGTVSKPRRKEIERECLNQLTRDRTMTKGGKLVDVRVASADGSPFAQGSVSELVGGVVATAAAAWASKDQGSEGSGGGKKKDPKDMSHDELVAELARRRKGGKK